MYQYYFHSWTRRVALILSVPSALLSLIWLPPMWSLILGAALALVLSLVVFPLFLWHFDRPYRRIAKLLPYRVLFRDRILLRLSKDRGCGACLYVYPNGLILCSVAKGEPMLLTNIPRKCVWQVQLQENIGQLRLCFYDNFFYEFYCTREDDLLALLKSRGWNVSDPPRT